MGDWTTSSGVSTSSDMAVIELDFDIQYTVPNDVDTVYMCGKSKKDLKIVWEKKQT